MPYGVDFINVQHTAFPLVDPESAKIQLSHQYLFTLSGSTSVKAVSKTLMKLTHARIVISRCSPCYSLPQV